jgi:hypothetical protein
MSDKPVEVRERTVEQEPVGVDSENVFTVLAARARSRSRAGLWTTTIGGLLNAGLIFWQYPSLSWLAASSVAVAAYGAWGLIDRTIVTRPDRLDAGVPEDLLPDMRALVVVMGTGAAGVAAALFMMRVLGWFR